MNKLILLTPFLLLMLMGIAGAATPSAIPSGIQYYVPINLTNSESTATAAPFQANIIINESTYSNYLKYNGTSANFELFNSTGSDMSAWIENVTNGNVLVWVKLPNGIPASSHIQVYLGFASKTTNLLSSSGTSGIGEAPQLSSTYAEYDDGASVFNNYWNFAGTTLPSGLTAYGDTSTVTVNNGITIEPNTNTWTGIYSTATISSPTIIETYATFPSTTGDGDVVGGYSSYAGGAGAINHPAGQDWAIGTTSSGSITAWTTNNTNTFPTTNTVFGFYFVSGALAMYGNYVQEITLTDSVTSDSVMLGRFPSSAYTTPLTATWLRTRAYPPSGVMPSVTFGAVQSTTPTLSISPNPATYGSLIYCECYWRAVRSRCYIISIKT